MLETGIPNLDTILGGGIPEGDVLLVVGPAGSGKTTLALQMAFFTAAAGQNALYVSTLSEPPPKVIQHVRSFSFFDESLIGKRLLLVSIYPLITEGLAKVIDAVVQAAKDHQARLIVLDGLMTVRELYSQASELRAFVYELGSSLAALDTTSVVTSSVTERANDDTSSEFTMADGILELGTQDMGSRTVRTVRSSKMRGLPNILGQHTLRIDREGVTVLPRIESVFEFQDIGLSREKVSLGLPELDAMMSGGPPAGSVTMLAGAMGTGKTLACLQYVVEGARRGERSLFLGFRETQRQLIDKARAFGMDLETPIKDGRVVVLHRPQIDLVADEVAWEILQQVQRLGARRLALDSVVEIEQSIVEERRRRGYLTALIGMLRRAGVTTLLTKEIAQVVGPELDFSNTPLAFLAENLVLLRYVEYRGDLFQILSVLKTRDIPHDHSIRQYTITDSGLKVLAKLESAEGLLTGIARLPSEARVKRTREARREDES